jgi:hypothetical protein
VQVHADDLVGGLCLPIRLQVEGGGEVELHACQGEQFTSEVIGEDRIAIGDDGAEVAMEPHNDVEECPRHCRRQIRMAGPDEVCALREAIDDGEQDRLAVDAWKPLDKIHAYVCPNRRG